VDEDDDDDDPALEALLARRIPLLPKRFVFFVCDDDMVRFEDELRERLDPLLELRGTDPLKSS